MSPCEGSLNNEGAGTTGNAWPLEQVFMEIISGNPNVNKGLTDLGRQRK